MESFGGSGVAAWGFTVRRKRSTVTRKPHLNPLTFSVLPFGKETLDKTQDSKEKVVHSDRLESENRPKKIKLKLRGVTHTIQTKSAAVSGVSSGSSILQSSSISNDFIPQLQSRLQDDIDGKDLEVKQTYSLKFDCSSRKEYSAEGVAKYGEPVSKSNKIRKRRISDMGLSEGDDGDEEIQFLKRLNASKVARTVRSQKDDGYHADDTGNCKLPRLGKNSSKKSRSGNFYEDEDYLGEEENENEEELAYDDELEANGKKLKKGSLSILLKGSQKSTPATRNRALQTGILTGYSSTFIDLAAPSRKKKEKISEVDKQSKKAEAAQRRKIQVEKMTKEAEDAAMRKILGQDTKKKRREDQMKQKRDELMQGRNAGGVTLAPNTVRWVNGPNGTVVTFSSDIGLPDIFTPVPCSYPPPREKCAGPNCTSAYKYRDSKSKLPLCSLRCYKALHGEEQTLTAC